MTDIFSESIKLTQEVHKQIESALGFNQRLWIYRLLDNSRHLTKERANARRQEG